MSTSYSRTGWRARQEPTGPIHYDPADLIPESRTGRASRRFATAAIAFAAIVFGAQALRWLVG